MSLDWKRICLRSAGSAEGKKGAVLLAKGEDSADGALAGTVSLRDGVCQALVKLDGDGHAKARSAAAKGARMLLKQNVGSIVIDDGEHAEALAEGVVLATYQYDALHSEKKTPVKIVYSGQSEAVRRAIVVAEAQNFSRFLGDTPANHMTPQMFCEYAKSFFEGTDVAVSVRDRSFAQEKKMGLFLGVSQGSEQEPRILEAVYSGRGGASDVDVVLVGKGITFDSGGISLKPPAKMALMKGDMLGGAAVVAVIGALARAKAQVNVAGVVMLTENLPSGRATKPGDVHTGMGGKTVEVDNTDAEGRLVLADGLAYSEKFGAPVVIDVATLTGAIKISLGGVFAGLFSNDDALAAKIVRAGEEAADPVWRMPCTEDYLELIKSDVADLRNIGSAPGGGSVTAALFLREFAGKRRWAHLDIAGVASESMHAELHGKGMSGRPVALLARLLFSWDK